MIQRIRRVGVLVLLLAVAAGAQQVHYCPRDGACTFTTVTTTASDTPPIVATNNAHVVGQTNRGTFFRCGVLAAGTKCYGSFAQSIEQVSGGLTQYTHFVGGDHNITIVTPFASAFSSDAYGVVAGLTAPADGGTGWPGAAFRAELQNSGTGIWATAYDVTDGAAYNWAIVRARCTSGSCVSMPILIHGMNAGVASGDVQLYADQFGSYHINPPSSGGKVYFDAPGNAVATSGANFAGTGINFRAIAWSGSASTAYDWTCNHNVNASGTLSVSQMNCTPPSSMPGGAVAEWVFGSATTTKSGHQKGLASASVAAGTGAGAGATVTLVSNSNDSFGRISVVTAGTPAASATVATVTFAFSYGNQPFCVLSPSNAAAAALTGTGKVFANGFFTSSFTIASGSTALATATTYLWDYHCGS